VRTRAPKPTEGLAIACRRPRRAPGPRGELAEHRQERRPDESTFPLTPYAGAEKGDVKCLRLRQGKRPKNVRGDGGQEIGQAGEREPRFRLGGPRRQHRKTPVRPRAALQPAIRSSCRSPLRRLTRALRSRLRPQPGSSRLRRSRALARRDRPHLEPTILQAKRPVCRFVTPERRRRAARRPECL
jgi:hypothetical protein